MSKAPSNPWTEGPPTPPITHQIGVGQDESFPSVSTGDESHPSWPHSGVHPPHLEWHRPF